MFSLRTHGLGKAYRIYRRPSDILKELFLRREFSETFWALRDVTFEVERGGSLGIIGDNGAGKTTLLRLLAGAIAPSVGRVERVGRVAAILSLGAGFHPDLSGTENIRMGCAVLGLSPGETAELIPQIAEFSELGHFLERPVRTYSTGMSLRLGFSVATAVNPDLLLLDEHLSVGDQHFQHKCLRRIMDLREDGCSLVFCSHNLHSVGEVCDRTIWLRDGQPVILAATRTTLDAYQDHVRARDVQPRAGPLRTESAQPARHRQPRDTFLREVALGGDCHDGVIQTGGTLEIRIVAQLTDNARREGVHVAVLIIRNDAVWCYGSTTKIDGLAQGLYALRGDEYGVNFVIDKLPLLSGQYSLTVALLDAASPHNYDYWSGIAPFSVTNDSGDVGVTRIAHRWEQPRS